MRIVLALIALNSTFAVRASETIDTMKPLETLWACRVGYLDGNTPVWGGDAVFLPIGRVLSTNINVKKDTKVEIFILREKDSNEGEPTFFTGAVLPDGSVVNNIGDMSSIPGVFLGGQTYTNKKHGVNLSIISRCVRADTKT